MALYEVVDLQDATEVLTMDESELRMMANDIWQDDESAPDYAVEPLQAVIDTIEASDYDVTKLDAKMTKGRR